jgi:hypothetical protein
MPHKYGWGYKAERAALMQGNWRVKLCIRCGERLGVPGPYAKSGSDPPEGDHDESGRLAGLSHRSCNRRAGAQKRNLAAAARKGTEVRVAAEPALREEVARRSCPTRWHAVVASAEAGEPACACGAKITGRLWPAPVSN